MKNVKLQTYINEIFFLIDASGSMQHLATELVKVFDSQIQYLQKKSDPTQETRVSVYLFNETTECLAFDMDVLRFPSLAGFYTPFGQTALIDATNQVISDAQKIPELYADKAFLIYVMSDGQSNYGSTDSEELKRRIGSLPNNYTLAYLAPDQNSVFEGKKCGFSAENISVWDTTAKGMKEVGEMVRQSTDNFMIARAKGVRGTKNLFSLDTSKISATAVKSNLIELKPTDYELLNVSKKAVIKPFIESWKIGFRLGSAYYQLTKPEKVQGHKQICVQNKLNGKVYGGPNARNLLGLPDYEVKVEPTQHPDYHLFIQSTSNNRNLVAGTKLLVMK